MSKPSYARVIIDRSIHRELDYLIPEMLAEKVAIGSRVRVPFRERSALATVVGVLVEVPVMLSVCRLCLSTRHWFDPAAAGSEA